MKTILVNPPSNTYRKPEEHLWLAYLRSYLLSNWYDCDVIDWYLLWIDNDNIVKHIVSDHLCNVVWLSPSIDSLVNTKEIIKNIKQIRKDIIILLWWHLATFSYGELLDEWVDFVVKWEWELTLLELIQCIDGNSKDFSNIKWLAYKNDLNQIIQTPSRNLIENLDCLPFPDRLTANLANQQWALTQISWSRWCYWNCSFCSINSLYRLSDWSVWRWRSADSIVQELLYLNKTYWFKIFKFVDDSFLWKWIEWQKRGFEIANKIIDAWLDIKFRISIRADSVDRSLFSVLKKAWLYSVSVGIESWHERALKTFNKGISVDKNREALNILKELEIITLMWFIWFDPYTNIPECEENLAFLKEMDFALVDVISKPLFIHAKDPITNTLMAEGRLKDRDFPNYKYEIADYRTKIFHKLLEDWNSYNKNIYYEITDMLTAPRITTKEQENLLIKLFKKIRVIDLNIYEMLLDAIKLGKSEADLYSILSNYKYLKMNDLNSIEQEFYNLIS